MSTAMEKSLPSLTVQEASIETDEKLTTLYNPDIDTSGVDERKLIRKIDLSLIPWLSFLYLLSFLDRTSIGKQVSFPLRHMDFIY
jgi:hypothetical protein